MPSGFVYDIVNFRKNLYICHILENEKTLTGKRVRTIFFDRSPPRILDNEKLFRNNELFLNLCSYCLKTFSL